MLADEPFLGLPGARKRKTRGPDNNIMQHHYMI